MAGKTTNSNSRSTKARNTSSKSTSANRKGTGKRKKKGNEDSIKVFFVLLGAALLVLILIILQPKEEKPTGGTGVTPLPTTQENMVPTNLPIEEPTKKPENGEEQKTQENSAGSQSAPTDSTAQPTKNPVKPTENPASPTPTPETETGAIQETTVTPTVLPELVTSNAAAEKIKAVVDTGIYKIELLNDHLNIDGKEYYQFCMSENGRDVEPFLIVEKKNGELYCYDFEGNVTEFEKFPLDNVIAPGDTGETSETKFTVEDAYKVLCKYSKESLGLAKNVNEYDAEFDDTLTLVKGVNCYRINLTEVSGGKVRNRGEYYVSVDGTQCFTIDSDLNDFVPVQ